MSGSSKRIEWVKFFQVASALFLVPLIFVYLVSQFWPAILSWAYYTVIALFLFQSCLSYLNSFSAIARKRFHYLPTARHKPVPKTTFIVSAYLPNEISVVESVLSNLLKKIIRPEQGLEVILAYNTPNMEEIEQRLKQMAYDYPDLILANAYKSRSKSENLNYALDIASGEMIVLIDADHIPSEDCLSRAWRWLDEGYDAVQGRCKIRNGSDSYLSGLIEVEFEAIYGISHYAKSLLFDSALFGGSNGYWKADVIKRLRFRKDMLTEDIDVTLRALLSGGKIVHDRSIISTELAPMTMSGLWYQRKRWAQGWFQVSVRYQKDVLISKILNLRQKFLWTTLLMWRVIYDIASHFIWPILCSYWLYRDRLELPMTPFIWFSLFFTLLSGPMETIAAYKNSVEPRPSGTRFIRYAFLTFFYTSFKNFIQVVAIRDELAGERSWVISGRGQK